MADLGLSRRSGDRVLLTGHLGRVGRAVAEQLRSAGHDVVGLDVADGDDINDPTTVAARIRGCSGLVHLAAVDDEPVEASALSPWTTGGVMQVMGTNVGGTSQVLNAAAVAGVDRVVFMSSIDVLGCFMGQRAPHYFPIDDHHPVEPAGSYSWSKLAGEELCAAFTRSTGTPTVCLRAPGVFDAETYAFIRSAREQRPEFEWSPVWEYGAFLDVRDLASAIEAALTVEGLTGHHRLIVCADDISSASEDSLTLANRLLPEVPVRAPERYSTRPFAALVDSGAAKRVLGWEPHYSWRPPTPA